MARGWESKSVEDQMAEKAQPEQPEKAAATARDRERRDLELQRERILNLRTSNPHRRAALEAALADVEERLKRLA